MKRSRTAFALAHVFALVVCTTPSCGPVDDWSLAAPGDPDDPRLQDLRRRLDILVQQDGSTPLPSGCRVNAGTTTATCDPSTFAALLDTGCGAAVSDWYVSGAGGTYLGSSALASNRQVCLSEALLRVADTVVPERVAVGAGEAFVLVPPQDTESQAELARLAMSHAREAALIALAALLDSANATEAAMGSPVAPPGSTAEGMTQGAHLALLAREGYQLMLECADHMVAASVAVADAQRSTQATATDAAVHAAAPFASRAAAAHLLVGGSHGLGALGSQVTDQGLFPQARLSDEGQRALAYLRAAAMDPAILRQSSRDIDHVVYDGSSVGSRQDTMALRLAVMQPDPDLYTAVSSIGPAGAYARLGVSRSAFVEAREYLVNEFRAFDRSPLQQLPPDLLPSGETTAHVTSFPEVADTLSFQLFAATRNPPVQPSAAWWSAVVRYNPTWVRNAGGAPPPLTWGYSAGNLDLVPDGFTYGPVTPVTGDLVEPQELAYGGHTLAASVETIAETARAVANRLQTLPGAGSSAAATLDIVGHLLSDVGRSAHTDASAPNAIGDARVCVIGDAAGSGLAPKISVDVRVPGLASGEVLVVNTHDALDCATRGTIDGAPCSDADISAGKVHAVWSGTDVSSTTFQVSAANWGVQTYASGTASSRPIADTYSLFLLRRRAGATADVGGWVALAGWLVPRPSSSDAASADWIACQSTPIAPGIDERVREAIAPSPAFPGDPALSCAGVPTDLQLPLENELTDNSNGVEDSWRHYLALAQSAADQADMLGETLIQEGLDMDLRAESAMDELQEICGVSLNVSPLTRIASTRPVGSGCSSPYVLRNAGDTFCVLDVVQAAATYSGDAAVAAQLAGCLGELSDNPTYTALGDRHLCLWTDDSTHTACGPDPLHPDPDHPCPFVANTDDTCPSTQVPPGVSLLPVVRSTLGLFFVPETPVRSPPSPSDYPCAALADLRAHTTGSAALQSWVTLTGNAFLTRRGFSDAAMPLRVEVTAGDYARVLFGNSVVFSTHGTSHWPMSDATSDVRPLCGATECFQPSTTSDALARLVDYNGPLFAIRGLGALAAGTTPGAVALRARLNDLLGRAVIAAHLLSGTSLRGSRVPFALPPIHQMWVDSAAFASIPGYANTYQSEDGNLFIDANAHDFSADGDERGLTTLHLVAESVVGQMDWTVCPYDRDSTATPCQAINADDAIVTTGEGEHVIDGTAYRLPLLVRTLDDSVDRVGNVDPLVDSIWGEGAHPYRPSAFPISLLRRTFAGVASSSASLAAISTPDGSVDLRQLTNYYSSYGAPAGVSGWQTVALGGVGPTERDFLNALELACFAARAQSDSADPTTFGCSQPMVFETVHDVLHGSDYLSCLADRVSDANGRSVVAGLPQSVIDAIHRSGPAVGGTGTGAVAVQVDQIQEAIIQLHDESSAIADEIRRYADALRIARNQVEAQSLASEIEDIRLSQAIANEITSCVVSAANIAVVGGQSDFGSAWAVGGAAAAAAATCQNGVFQSLRNVEIRGLQGREGQLEVDNALATADLQFVESAGAIRRHTDAIRAALARIQAALDQLRTLRARGRTALARALFLDDTSTGRHLAVDSVMHRRYNTTLTRYRDAFQRAQRLAYIARVALEQRLAMHLSEMHDDLITVNAPARWADELCTLSPLDYETLRMSSADGSVVAPDNYAGYYLGDYVRRLDQVFESYSFAHPFHEGEDTVVVSLRDDIFRTTRACTEAVPNLLYNAGALDARQTDGRVGWTPRGCVAGAGVCVSTTRAAEVASAMPAYGDALGGPAPTTITFGTLATSGTRLSQYVDLDAGRYRLAWFGFANPASTGSPIPTVAAVRALDDTGVPLDVLDAAGGAARTPQTRAAASPWVRHDYFFDVPRASTVEIAVVPAVAAVPGASVVIGGVQLVRAGALFDGDVNASLPDSGVAIATRFEPGLFYNTDDSRAQLMPNCADDGTEFRRRAFIQECYSVCPDGYGGTCDPAFAAQRCAWRTSFDVNSDALERLLTHSAAGFAAGNYNYRFRSLAVNLVGTGLRECGSAGSAGCYSSGNFSYSMVHHGPYFVRDDAGGVYVAPLFTGRIEGARALAAERYLSNPTSSSDMALIQPYVRTEFAGRPLGGTVQLRVWDDDTLAFSRLEDVQLVLTYRYWQRQR